MIRKYDIKFNISPIHANTITVSPDTNPEKDIVNKQAENNSATKHDAVKVDN